MDIRVIPLKLIISYRLPLLGSGKMVFLIHCDGGILRVNTALHIWWRASTTGSPPYFRFSAVFDGSHPRAFPAFICSIAFAVSLLVILPVSIGRSTSAGDRLMPAFSGWLVVQDFRKILLPFRQYFLGACDPCTIWFLDLCRGIWGSLPW